MWMRQTLIMVPRHPFECGVLDAVRVAPAADRRLNARPSQAVGGAAGTGSQ